MALTIILFSAGVLAVVGLVLGVLIGFTAKKFAVETDPRIESVQELLPGANCGMCGFAGCADLADAIVTRGVEPGKCAACSEENLKKIAALMGGEAAAKVKKVAVVFCGGSTSRCARNAKYNGIQDCRNASIVAGGGGKSCRFGCLGYGSCARACPFGAIEIRDGLAIVHPDICRGCGKCESVCPRKLIRMVPATAQVHVFCNSLDKPVVKRKNCKVTCLACGKCVRADGEKMNKQGELVRVNYANPPDPEFVERVKCPTGALSTVEAHLKAAPLAQEVSK